MKTVFKLFVYSASIAALFSCAKEITAQEEYPAPAIAEKTVLKATVPDTKTILDGVAVTWAENDRIAVNGVASEELASSKITEAGKKADFTFGSAIEAPYHAIYPASAFKAGSYSAGKATVVIPTSQTRVTTNGFDPAAAIMLGKTGNETLVLSHAVSYLKITFDSAVTSLEISALGSQMLSGEFETTFAGDLTPVKGSAAGSVTISAAEATTGPWIIAVPAQTYDGIVITAMNASGKVMTKKKSSSFTTVAGTIYDLTSTGNAAFSGNRTAYFVKTAAAGTGDGSSWDNAASFASMKTLITKKDGSANGYNFYLAEGTYNSTNGFNAEISFASFASSTKFTIFGGYPSSATGTSLGGRDILNHPTIIDAESTRRIFVINTGNIDITLNGLTLSNASYPSNNDGVAIVVHAAGNALFEDCIIENTTSGPAIRFNAASTWKRCTFRNNNSGEASCPVGNISNTTIMQNCVFENNIGSRSGAIIVNTTNKFTSEGNIYRNNIQGTWDPEDATRCTSDGFGGGAMFFNINSCQVESTGDTFENNKAGVGGAIAVGYNGSAKTGSTLTITNSTFKGNRAGRKFKTFSSSTVGTDPLGGGALYLNGVTATITGCTFDSNVTSGGNDNNYTGCGGAATVTGSTDASFTLCSFIKNRTGNVAGSVYAANLSAGYPVKLRDCVFDGKNQQNAASRGGALRTYGTNSRIYADRCVFKNHIVKSGYGSVLMTSGGGMALNNCTFYNNRVSTEPPGGKYNTVYINSTGPMVLVNCSFWDNPKGNEEATSQTISVLQYGAVASPSILINNMVINSGATSVSLAIGGGSEQTGLVAANNVTSKLGGLFSGKAGITEKAYDFTFGLSWDPSTNQITRASALASADSVDYSAVNDLDSGAFYNWVTADGFAKDGKGNTRNSPIWAGAYNGQ